jgi:4-oxalocrotonate tautomerase
VIDHSLWMVATPHTEGERFSERPKAEHTERTMPHVIVKLWPGKSEQQKTRLAEAITKDVMDILHYGEGSVSVAMEEVKSQNWAEKVYKPDIQDKWDKLHKKPGYDVNDL